MLIEQRLKWEQEYLEGKAPTFRAYLDYKKHRNTEYFRLNQSLEEFFEFVLMLESKVNTEY